MTANNNHRKSGCEFAEETVAFLYGEGGSDKKPGFEKHFEICGSCADELAAFGFVRSSIQEWRDDVFAEMPSPQIVIPGLDERAVSGDRRANSWLEMIKGFFSERPLFAVASTAFAVFAICLGIIVAISSNPGAEQVAGTIPAVEADGADSQIAAQTPQLSEPVTPQTEKSGASPVKIADERIANNRPERKPAKPAGNDANDKIKRPDGNRFNPNDPTIAKDDKTNPKSKANSPTIDEIIISNFAAEEEETIRLADLFDEVGSKK